MPDTIWITGASGFSGGHLLKAVREAMDARIIAVTNNTPKVEGADETVALDIVDTDQVAALARDFTPDGVFHLAGLMPPAGESDMFRVNVQGTYSLLCGLRASDALKPRVLITGSAAEYVPIQNGYYSEDCQIGGAVPYGRSKAAQTLLAQRTAEEFGLDVVVARPFNLIGPGLSNELVAGNICHQLAVGKTTLKLGNVYTARDFVDVRDAVEAYISIYRNGQSFKSYNVCTGKATTITDLVDAAAQVYGVGVDIQSDTALKKKQDFNVAYGNPEKTKAETGWFHRYSLNETFKSMKDLLVNNQGEGVL